MGGRKDSDQDRAGQRGGADDRPDAKAPGTKAEERRQRQAEALRANLRRRKAQSAGRAADAADDRPDRDSNTEPKRRS